MRLSDRAALIIIGAMLVGTWLPEIPLGMVRINIGGALVPFGLAVYLIGTADTYREQVRGVIAIFAVTASVMLLDWALPQEPGAMFIDPLYAYGIAAGIIGYLAGRSRRSAFVGGVMGILFADLITLFQQMPLPNLYQIGGGVFDSALIAGVIAVGFAELFGETRELVAPDSRHRNNVAWLEDKRREKNKGKKGR